MPYESEIITQRALQIIDRFLVLNIPALKLSMQ